MTHNLLPTAAALLVAAKLLVSHVAAPLAGQGAMLLVHEGAAAFTVDIALDADLSGGGQRDPAEGRQKLLEILTQRGDLDEVYCAPRAAGLGVELLVRLTSGDGVGASSPPTRGRP